MINSVCTKCEHCGKECSVIFETGDFAGCRACWLKYVDLEDVTIIKE